MFAFNPGNEDQSGRILGGAYANAAQTTADANVKLADDIGSSLVSLAAAYGSKKGTEAKGKNFKKFMGMAGDTFGMDSAMFGDMEDYDAGMMLENFAPMMPAMANAQLGRQRVGVQQQGQQMTTDRMYAQEQLRRERDLINKPPQSNSAFTGGSKVRGLFNNQ
jgi:hypothetical protein